MAELASTTTRRIPASGGESYESFRHALWRAHQLQSRLGSAAGPGARPSTYSTGLAGEWPGPGTGPRRIPDTLPEKETTKTKSLPFKGCRRPGPATTSACSSSYVAVGGRNGTRSGTRAMARTRTRTRTTLPLPYGQRSAGSVCLQQAFLSKQCLWHTHSQRHGFLF